MLRHVTAPACALAQIPNVILRHPRLSSDAKNLLNWQLSSPPTTRSASARPRARPGSRSALSRTPSASCSTRATCTSGGCARTAGRSPPSNSSPTRRCPRRRPSPSATVSARARRSPFLRTCAQGRAAECRSADPRRTNGPAVGRLPKKNTGENTTQPTGPAPEPAGGPPDSSPPDPGVRPETEPRAERRPDAPARDAEPTPATHAAAEALLLSLGRIDPRLAMPARTARRWAPLAAKWLASGLPQLRIRHTLTEGLSSARKPLGALHWRLQHALPDVPPAPPQAPALPAPEPRVARMRECATRHDQPRLFTPPTGSDEKLCRECRTTGEPAPPPPSAGSGFAAFAAARQAQSFRPRPPQRPRSIHRHRQTV